MKIKLEEDAFKPLKGTSDSAGYDLFSRRQLEIEPGQTGTIDTGIYLEIPQSCVGLVFARSGLACKCGVRPANCVGVIDSDYRGELKVCLRNDSAEPQKIEVGDRVAQLVIVPYMAPALEVVAELDSTERGSGGFGSTGR